MMWYNIHIKYIVVMRLNVLSTHKNTYENNQRHQIRQFGSLLSTIIIIIIIIIIIRLVLVRT